MTFDYVIVGSGLTGATLARHLADAGYRVQVLERRDYVGGNIADARHDSGILVGLHGPHYFRTSSQEIWDFVTRFAEFHPFAATVQTMVDGRLENWPVAASYIRRAVGDGWKPTNLVTQAENFEQAALTLMPPVVYEKFVKGYTEKQWGVAARSLAAALCKRFDVRLDDNPYLTPKAKFQGVPVQGYTSLIRRMLQGIPVELRVDWLSDRRAHRAARLTVFTGPIDAYFNYSLGRLSYRGQRRHTSYFPSVDHLQPCGQVNYPDPADGDKIRSIEWKHMMRPDLAAATTGTVITTETPCSPVEPDQYEYPFPDDANQRLYESYQRLSRHEQGVLFCGRLGEYRYFDMDQAIGRAMMMARRILNNSLAEAA